MPLDMQRAPKIPMGDAGPSDVAHVSIDRADDGSFIVTCDHDGGETTKYTLPDAGKLSTFVAQKFSGAPTDAMPEAEPEMEEPPAPPPPPPGPPPGASKVPAGPPMPPPAPGGEAPY